jgi:hypothetical protein
MAAFHDLDHTALDQVGRRQRFNALATALDRALGDLAAFAMQQVADGTQCRGLAGAVATEQGNDAALRARKGKRP